MPSYQVGKTVTSKLPNAMRTIQNRFVLLLLTSILHHSVGAQAIRGWGPSTKGVAIGTGVGAAAGAIINKRNRVVGGVVGGIVGGTAGYAAGKYGNRWSPQAKGTAIGAGTGAAAGAIINKRNRAVGGIIGGVAGGAAGYAIGKHVDNKRKAEAARVAAAQRAAEEREAAAREREAVAAREAAAQEQTELAKGSQNRTYTATTAPEAPAKKGNTARLTTVFDQPVAPVPYVLPAGLLPNESYGDSSTPYGDSQYRRKSW